VTKALSLTEDDPPFEQVDLTGEKVDLTKDLTDEEVDLTTMEVDDNEAEQEVEEMYSNDINETED
jgi:hypothetical protein